MEKDLRGKTLHNLCCHFQQLHPLPDSTTKRSVTLMCDDPNCGVLYLLGNKLCEGCQFSYVLERQILDHTSQCIVMVVIFAALYRGIIPEGAIIS